MVETFQDLNHRALVGVSRTVDVGLERLGVSAEPRAFPMGEVIRRAMAEGLPPTPAAVWPTGATIWGMARGARAAFLHWTP